MVIHFPDYYVQQVSIQLFLELPLEAIACKVPTRNQRLTTRRFNPKPKNRMKAVRKTTASPIPASQPKQTPKMRRVFLNPPMAKHVIYADPATYDTDLKTGNSSYS